MSDFLETTYDKFIFKVKKGLYYSRDDFWAEVRGDEAVVGICDFLQKVSGDVAYLETLETGAAIRQGDEAGRIETIKSTFGIIAPVSGTIIEVNPKMESAPHLINQEPYGTGWIYRIRLADWAGDQPTLLDPDSYMALMQEKIIQEMEKK